MKKVYALTFNDKPIVDTVSPTKDDCWMLGFAAVSARYPGFQDKHWKQWKKSIKAARKLGYKIEAFRLVRTKA